VGGWVRDLVLGIESKDIDVETYGLEPDGLRRCLEKFGTVDLVGESFGVYRIHGLDVDWSLPRTESKTGPGHQGFEVVCDPDLTPIQAATRRDFTFNAMAWDPVSSIIIDPFQGRADITEGILRHTSDQFVEDPLRVLRGFQFAGRFGLFIDDETAELCRDLRDEYSALAVERVWGEWWKWATRSIVPSAGLEVLRATGWVEFYPELSALIGLNQEPEWHPEGDVWEHTCQAVDAAAFITYRDQLDDRDTAVVVFSALLHDIGKVDTTFLSVDGRIISPGHAEASTPLAELFLERIGAPQWLIDRVIPLVREHMVHLSPPSTRLVRRLSRRLGPATIENLVRVIEADHSARGHLSGGTPESAQDLLGIARDLDLQDQAPAPLLMGRHLIDLGWEPGPVFGGLLRQAFEAQLDGDFEDVDGAVAWAEDFIGTP